MNTLAAFFVMFFVKSEAYFKISTQAVIITFIGLSILSIFPLPNPNLYSLILLLSISLTSWSTSFYFSGLLKSAINKPKYIVSAISTGQGISGLLASLLNIIQLSTSTSNLTLEEGCKQPTMNYPMFIYFLSVSLFYCLLLYLSKGLIWVRNDQNTAPDIERIDSQETEVDELSDSLLEEETAKLKRSERYKAVSRKIKYEIMTIFLTLGVSIAAFPALVSRTKTEDYYSSQKISLFFVPWLFIVYNLADVLGRQLTTYYVIKRPKTLFALSLCRTSLIFLIYNTNLRNNKIGFFQDNVWPVVFNICLGVSNGFCSTCALILPSRTLCHKVDEKIASNLNTFFLSFGLIIGSYVGLLLSQTLN
eukprot:snap_masked-scaffold_2-processed-gene-15.15-mRNA-1 protein AED:1.00 eAED:1.00 QI:0/-1/0/0/-1/1/1/0/362